MAAGPIMKTDGRIPGPFVIAGSTWRGPAALGISLRERAGTLPGHDGTPSNATRLVTRRARPMAEDTIRKELDTLKADIAQLREDIAGLTDAVKKVAAAKAQNARNQAEEKARDAWEDIEEKLNDILEEGKETVAGMEEQIARHPGGSLLTAFGLGFIIARLLDGGSRR
ncbi:MAG TPA: DUF883 family protein [Gammaproteobacteria bacterium]|nr:DUF883 family protein [Gammaproteobacteria bacterium]